MQIKSYNKQQLQQFIDSDFYKMSERIPISSHRAVSHIHNPDCADGDVLLWAAYEDDKLIGYVGVLPGLYRSEQGDDKIYWLSCFWVDTNYRKSNVASMLFFPLVKIYKDNLFISNFIPSLEKMYQGLGIFQPTVYKGGDRFYYRFSLSTILPSRFPKLGFLKPVYVVADVMLNGLFSVKSGNKALHYDARFVENRNFDDEFQKLLDRFRTGSNYASRDAQHFEWVLNYPWIVEGKPDRDSKRYYFSSRAKQFSYNSLRIYQDNILAGYILLKTRDKNLTIDYLYADDSLVPDISAFLLQKIKTEKLKSLSVFDSRVGAEMIKYKKSYLIHKKTERPYILPRSVNASPDCFQAGDGDNVFT